MDDPVIQAELHGNVPHQQPRSANDYYVRPQYQDEATVNDDELAELHNRENINALNYGSIPQGQPIQQNIAYPQHVDPSIAGIVHEQEMERKSRSRCLDFFTKLRGEDERQDFLLKVFTIMSLQTALTVLFIVVVMKTESIKNYLQTHVWLYWTWFALTIATLCLIVWFNKIGRTAPWNYIAWFFFTLFYSVMVSTVTSFYEPESVFICAILTLVMFSTLVFIALTTKRSLPILCAMLLVALVLSIFSLILMIFYSGRWLVILISIAGLIIASIYVLQ